MTSNDADRRVGFRLQVAREAMEWNQSELSRHLTAAGLPWSQGTLSRVETGQRAVRLTEAVVLAEVLGISLNELVPGHTSLDSALRRIHEKEETALRQCEMAAGSYLCARNLAQLLRLSVSLRDNPTLELTVDRSAPRAMWDGTMWSPLEDIGPYELLEYFGLGRDRIETMREAAKSFMQRQDNDSEAALEELLTMSPSDFRMPLIGPGASDGSPGDSELRMRHLLLSAGEQISAKYPNLTFEESTLDHEGLRRSPIHVRGLSAPEAPALSHPIGTGEQHASPSA